MLMVPVLLSVFFFVIEMSLYFTTVHYGTYAAFVTARSQEVGFSQKYPNADAVSELVMTGAIWQGDTAIPVADSKSGKLSGVSVQVTDFEEKVPFPFLKPLMPNLDLNTQVFLGPDERKYEGVEGRSSDKYDNNL
jgi:hypothetical protein